MDYGESHGEPGDGSGRAELTLLHGDCHWTRGGEASGEVEVHREARGGGGTLGGGRKRRRKKDRGVEGEKSADEILGHYSEDI